MSNVKSVQGRYDWSAVPPSVAVVKAIASLEDVRPVDLPALLDGPLYDFIDPGALNAVVTGEGEISISFAVGEYDVRIDGDELGIHYN